jgi:teichuronic acid biosynthesis glycosyltransferase TuaH
LSDPQKLDVVCLSLEPWDNVWRRNQHLASELLRLRPAMRLLFVESPVDVVLSLIRHRWPRASPLRAVGTSGRLWAMTPKRWLPRRIRPQGDESLFRQVLAAARQLAFDRPLLWINDNMYAPLLEMTHWPSVYDVTDDWLLVGGSSTAIQRQRRNDALMLQHAKEVVVCSPSLVQSRGGERQVHLIPNGVDLDFFRSQTHRPGDLPAGRIVMYQGTLVDSRLDLGLCLRLCDALERQATLVFVGPNRLSKGSTRALSAAGAVILGERAYVELPGYLQHADVLVVPHQITPFTESLDPIKAREFQAVGRPVVSTPIAGFRGLGPPISVANGEDFVRAVKALVDGPALPSGPGPLQSDPTAWSSRANDFLAVIEAAAGQEATL